MSRVERPYTVASDRDGWASYLADVLPRRGRDASYRLTGDGFGQNLVADSRAKRGLCADVDPHAEHLLELGAEGQTSSRRSKRTRAI
jgi:hypothetical protein